MAQQDAGGGAVAPAQARGAAQAVHDQGLDRHHPDHHAQQGQGLARDDAQVQSRAHSDEEQAQQQAPERLDIGFQLAPELALGQHHAGQEGAERRRQPDHLHQGRHGDHQQQGRGGEDLAQARGGNEAEDRPDQVAPTARHHGHRAQDGQPLHPGGRVGQQAGRMGLTLSPALGQQGQHGEQGDDRQVLQQQHAEGRLAHRPAPQAFFLKRLQHDGGRRHGQDQAHRHGRAPVQAQRQAADRQGGGGGQDLGAPQAEDRAAQAP